MQFSFDLQDEPIFPPEHFPSMHCEPSTTQNAERKDVNPDDSSKGYWKSLK